MLKIKDDIEKIVGEWNGDESGPQEERALLAHDTLELIAVVEKNCEKLGLTLQ